MPILIKFREKKPPAWQERLICFGMFLIFSLLFFYVAQNLEQEFRLYRHGIFTEGTALRSERARGGYALFYKFNYNGFAYQGVSDVKESWLNSAKLPTAIRVHFLADDPGISRVPEAREDSLLWFNILFFCFCCLAVFVLGLNLIHFWIDVIGLLHAMGAKSAKNPSNFNGLHRSR